MERMNHSETAVSLFMSGCNCSQAVFAAYCDEMKIEKEFALRLSSSFGGGMGRLREVCGTVSAMFLVSGVLSGYSDIKDKSKKDEHYKRIQFLANEFRNKQGSYICREILKTNDTSPVSTERSADFYRKRPCLKCVECACKILDEYYGFMN